MKKAIFLSFFLTTSLIAGEQPGKTVLFPNNEIEVRRGDLESITVKKSVTLFTNDFEIEGIKHKFTKGNLKFNAKDIQSIAILKQVPKLRGNLIDVYESEDKAYLSQLFLRIDLEQGSYVFGMDYGVTDDGIAKVLKSDYKQIGNLKLPVVFRGWNLETFSKESLKFQKETLQYFLDLNKNETKNFLSNYFNKIKKYDWRETFHPLENNSSLFIFSALTDALSPQRNSPGAAPRIRMRSNRRGQEAVNNIKKNHFAKNPFFIEKNLELRGIKGSPQHFRFFNLKDEVCTKFEKLKSKANCPNAVELEQDLNLFENDKRDFAIADDISNLRKEAKKINLELKSFYTNRVKKEWLYIHKGEPEQIDFMTRKILTIDNYLLTLKNKTDNTALLSAIKTVREELWSEFTFNITLNNDYVEVRFFNEGGFFKDYPKNFAQKMMKGLRESVGKKVKIKKADKKSKRVQSLLVSLEDAFILPKADITRRIQEFRDTPLEVTGNAAGDKLVNVLGQVFKKRPWVPYIRVATMFRDNHLTAYRDRVLKQLLSPGAMEIGDIILEKDMQANTDTLIPGYWVHASIYMGTIKEMKAIGIWDDPGFAIIQYEIEKYRTSPDRQHYLNNVWKNKKAFEDIPWFYESDRPGVGVHPLIKFLKTDGMAVLRPTKNWNTEAIKHIFKRANDRMYFPYDYVHDTKRKFWVSCSKVVLKVFDQVTFPVSKNLEYISVSPDQIGQPVSLDPTKPEEGELKLIQFFDAEDEGKLRFDHRDPKTFHVYPEYLKNSGTI